MSDLAIINLSGQIVGGMYLVLTHDLGDPHNWSHRRLVELVFGRQTGVALILGNRAYRISGSTKHLATIAERALRALAPSPPVWLPAALWAAARVAEHSTASNAHHVAIHLISLAHKFAKPGGKPLSDAEIAALAERNAQAIFSASKLHLPSEPISLAKLLFAVSKLTWDCKFVTQHLHCPPIHTQIPAITSAMINTCALWLWPMVGPIKVGNARMDAQRTFTPEAAPRLWPICWALRDATEDEARACLIPFIPLPPSNVPIEEPPNCQVPSTPDPALCAALARQLADEAERKAAYAPQGVFDAELPPSLPLVDWGVHRLRLVRLRPKRIWAVLLGRQGDTLAAFPWQPDGTRLEGGMMIPHWAWDVVDLAISALWHDLCIAGPTALPGLRVGTNAKDNAPSPAPAQNARTPRPTYLPRPRYALIGCAKPVSWGGAEDRTTILRAAATIHAVRGHYRRHEYVGERRDDERSKLLLRKMREAATARASHFGLPPPPPGYTFVSPHLRGDQKKEDTAISTQHVRARGLAALSGVLATSSSASMRHEPTRER